MTEEIAATPGWVSDRLDAIFAGLPHTEPVQQARRAYADCLASRKPPGAPSDLLGAEFGGCRARLKQALLAQQIDFGTIASPLEALEAEIAADS